MADGGHPATLAIPPGLDQALRHITRTGGVPSWRGLPAREVGLGDLTQEERARLDRWLGRGADPLRSVLLILNDRRKAAA